MKRLFILMLCWLTCNSTFAGSVSSFYQGLQSSLYLKRTTRGQELENHIRITKFSKLGRVLSPDASATYNDKTNTISLDESLLNGRRGSYQIKNASEILTPNYQGYYKVSTIFHELAHAEIDIFIENKKELTDLALMNLYRTKLKPLYKKYFKGANPWVAFHEHFAYYRSDLVETLSMDIMDVMLDNGWIPQNNRCFLTNTLKALLRDGATMEEFQKVSTQRTRDYRQVVPGQLYIRGKDLDLSKVAPTDLAILKEAHQQFWFYHLEFYGFPRNLNEIVQYMDRDTRYKKLKECREKLYDQGHAIR